MTRFLLLFLIIAETLNVAMGLSICCLDKDYTLLQYWAILVPMSLVGGFLAWVATGRRIKQV